MVPDVMLSVWWARHVYLHERIYLFALLFNAGILPSSVSKISTIQLDLLYTVLLDV